MYCPNCKQEFDGKFCPECGTKLIERPADSGVNLNFGDATAVSGGLHVSDSHDVHNEDKSIHNITNTTSTVNNITQVSAQKTEMELLQERKTLYLNACKRAYEDNVLEQSEVVALEELRIKIGLDKSTADNILESVRVMSDRNARKSELNPIAKTKLKILTSNLQKNEVKALMDQIDSLEPLVRRFDHDELSRKYYLVLSALKPEKCIEQKERTKTDTYWEAFWCYLAYIKAGRLIDAEETLASLDHFSNYPEDNMTVLAAAGALMKGHPEEAKKYLDATTGDYTLALQRFVDSLYLLLAPQKAKKSGADENTCAFYLVNFFGQKDPKVKAEEERIRKAKEEEEAKRKAKEEEAKRKAKEAEEARKRAEEERRRLEAERKAKEETIRKAKEAEEAKHRAEEAKRRAEAEAIRKAKEAEEAKRRAEEEARRKAKEAEEAKRKAAFKTYNGHEYVDLGLPSGTLWATCNIGASKPEEFGNYFAWGETSGYDEGKRYFDDEHYKFRIKKKSLFGSKWIYTKYCDNKKNGEVDNILSLDKEDDAAYVQWGKGWRMPTTAQFEELINKDYTTLEQLSKSGVKGLLITSKANGNSIFLPEAGHHGYYEIMSLGHTWEKNCSYYSKQGNYWTRERLTGTYQNLILSSILTGNLEYAGTHYYDDTANSLCFSFRDDDSLINDEEISCFIDKNENDMSTNPDEHRSRCEGYSIRPVRIEE